MRGSVAGPGLYVRQLALGAKKNFVYLVGAADSAEVAVVDPAWDVPAIERALAVDGKHLACAVVTHHHDDHINGLPQLVAAHRLSVFAQPVEIAFSEPLRVAAGPFLTPVPEGGRLVVGGVELELLHTPGHSPGSQCVHTGDAVFTGDTLFVNACGRCDLPGGDPCALHHSLTEVLRPLPDATRVFPGHDYGDVPVSTLGRERSKNPYLLQPDLPAFVAFRMRR